jgi:hexokinase
MRAGLDKEGQMLKMLPSYVEQMPSGTESGEFLAIDLGGTNLRVVKVVLENSKVKEVLAHEDSIPKEIMKGTTKQLFEFIAVQIKTFVSNNMEDEGAAAAAAEGEGLKKKKKTKKSKNSKPIPIGFTFSYPMKQNGLRSGELVCWTKGFDIKDTLGKDLVELLQSAMKAQNINAKVFAILNDTVGTLAASKFMDQDTQLGVILGTGSNAAYIEQTSSIQKLQSMSKTKSSKKASKKSTSSKGGTGQMIVNIEWGNFKSELMPYLEEDREIDIQLANKGQQHFEKMISGMYLGEIARRIFSKASKEINLFGGTQQAKLDQQWSFPTSLLSKIDGIGTMGLPKIEALLCDSVGIDKGSISESDVRFVAEVCTIIGERSSTLAATGVVAIYKHLLQSKQVTEGQRFVAAVDGGLFEHYPRYPEMMAKTVAELIGEDQAKCFELVHSPDGSGIGAAVVAAASSSSSSSSS